MSKEIKVKSLLSKCEDIGFSVDDLAVHSNVSRRKLNRWDKSNPQLISFLLDALRYKKLVVSIQASVELVKPSRY